MSLESHYVNYPTEEGNEFLADEMPLCARNLLRENVLEREAGTRNKPAHLGHTGQQELVEVWRIVVLREVRRSLHIIPARAQLPVFDVICAQRQARNMSLENTTILKIIGTHLALL